MFYGALVFNRDFSSWEVSNASDFRYMFADAHAFSQNLCSWTKKMPRELPVSRLRDMFGASNDQIVLFKQKRFKIMVLRSLVTNATALEDESITAKDKRTFNHKTSVNFGFFVDTPKLMHRYIG